MGNRVIVRKILSEALTSVSWDRQGQGPMMPPFIKAQKQAEYLQGLPSSLKNYFPEVFSTLTRHLPVPPYTQNDGAPHYLEAIYEMSFIPGMEVSQFIKKFSPPPQVVACLYKVIIKFLHDHVHSLNRTVPTAHTLELSYFQKIEGRLQLCRQSAPRIFDSRMLDSKEVTINGTHYRNCLSLIEHLRGQPCYLKILEPRFHSLVMGDTNTENIKISKIDQLMLASKLIQEKAPASRINAVMNDITVDSLGLAFLDPRSIGFNSDGAYTQDDPMYDNKPWHNSVGHYDEIHHDFFDLRVETDGDGPLSLDIAFHDGNPFQRAYRVRDISVEKDTGHARLEAPGIEDLFASTMTDVLDLDSTKSAYLRDDPYWLVRFVFVMGTHFAAMPPFHFQSELDGELIDDYQAQRRPIAIYCEGVKWLNWAVQLLEGRRTSFLGIKAPTLPHH